MTNQEAISVLESINAKTDYFLINDDARAEAIDMAISALREKDSLIARLKAEAIKRNILYMKSGDRYFVGFVDGVRLARSIVDGSIDEPKYVYPSEALDEQSRSD